MSKLFDNTKLKVLDRSVYEECNMRDDELNITYKYRQVFNDDDYDYVEDEELINRLDKELYI